MSGRIPLIVALIAAGIGAPAGAEAARIVALGDSWTARGAGVLAQVLADRGHPAATVATHAVAGSSAAFWADNPTLVDAALAANPDAGYVWLSLGGNDVTNALFEGRGDEAKAANARHLATVVARVFVARPDLQVVAFGYDFPAFVEVQGCLDPLFRLLGIDPPDVIDPGLANLVTGIANLAVLDAVGAVLEDLARADSRVHYVPLWGTLQQAAGRPANPLAPSPGSLYADCIHPTDAGFRALMDAFYGAFWSGEFAGEPALTCAAAPREGSPLALAPLAVPPAGLGVGWIARRIRRRGTGGGRSRS